MIPIKVANNCCGCYACSNVCPKNAIIMKEDEEGFKYPSVDEKKCLRCNLCEKVCPNANKKKIINNEPKAYACINNNETIRKQSSSGGIFTLIAEEILNQGGVVFGAKFNDNFDVVHSFVEKKNDLKLFRGSKYVQSQIGDCYIKTKEFLENDRYVLFTGTPCQIDGLYLYLQKDYNKLYTQDIICHGVPSPMVWKKYKDYRKKIDKDIPKNIDFRNKDNGWKKFNLKIQYNETNSYKKEETKDMYMKAFLSNLSLRPSCYNCNSKSYNRKSDITLADFWGINYVLPKMDDNKGTSLVIVNSEKGKWLFEKIKDKMKYEQVSIEEALKYNPSMVNSAKENPKRKEFFDMLSNSSFDQTVNKCIPEENIIKKIIKKVLRKITKTIK